MGWWVQAWNPAGLNELLPVFIRARSADWRPRVALTEDTGTSALRCSPADDRSRPSLRAKPGATGLLMAEWRCGWPREQLATVSNLVLWSSSKFSSKWWPEQGE